jgi:hypothetical protein
MFLFLETFKKYNISESTVCWLSIGGTARLSWPSQVRAGNVLVSEYGRLTCGGRNSSIHPFGHQGLPSHSTDYAVFQDLYYGFMNLNKN